jgi:hypothetical protein
MPKRILPCAIPPRNPRGTKIAEILFKAPI